jgi:hypothetical protein
LFVLADAYGRLGADGRAADASMYAVGQPEQQSSLQLSATEATDIRRWLARLADPSISSRIRVARPDLFPTGLPGAAGAAAPNIDFATAALLDELAGRVESQIGVAHAETIRWSRLNLRVGVLAATAATGAGVAAGFTEFTGWARLWIVVPALGSAAFSALLATMKPSEREQAAQVREKALTNLAEQIQLFEEFVGEVVPLGSKVRILDVGVEQRTHAGHDPANIRAHIYGRARVGPGERVDVQQAKRLGPRGIRNAAVEAPGARRHR